MSQDSDRNSDRNSETCSDDDIYYDPFDEFCNGNPARIMEWIRAGKVSVNARDEKHGDTLLQWACRHAHEALIRFLLRRPCPSLNHLSHADGCTALDLCTRWPTMVEVLRAHGAKTSDEVDAEQQET